MSQILAIVFKFGGYWSVVKNTSRRKYEGGKQRTVKFDKNLINLLVLREKVEEICPWLSGHRFGLHYHIPGTSPKEYTYIETDHEVLEMAEQSIGREKVEIVTILHKDMGNEIFSEDVDDLGDRHTLEYYHSSPSSMDTTSLTPEGTAMQLGVGGSSTNSLIAIGIRFPNAYSFKQALRTMGITNNFGVKIKASDKARVIATCSHKGCPWRVRASISVDGESFEVKKLDGAHTCPGVNRAGNRLASSSWVAAEIQDMVKKFPNITPKHIKNSMETTYGLSLPYMKIWRAIEQARNMIFGSVNENYSWVPLLHAELISRNPGSHITYCYDSADCSFKRFYVSFKVCIDGFLAGCRHLVGLDACHLKSKYLGMLLSANTLDGNDGLYTLAFAVVESESKSTWRWFLENLLQTFGLDVNPLAFISDMEKGLGEAICEIFPDAEHRVCLRHLWKNLKKYFHCSDGHKLKNLVWAAANSYIVSEYEAKVFEIYNISPHIHSYLMSLPYKWSKSTFSCEIKNIQNTNNMAESFNSWITEARDKPAVDLIDFIRGMLMEQRAIRKMNSASWFTELVPHTEEYIREITTRKEQFIIRPSTCSKAEIESRHERHEVDIERRECTCKFWQISGLPCIHVVAFIGSKEHPLWHTYVDEQYHVNRYKMAYEGAIATLSGKEQWKPINDDVKIGPPNTMRPRGRPRKNRYKNFLEGGIAKSRSVHQCSRCGLWGHHRRTCKNPLSQASTSAVGIEQASQQSTKQATTTAFRAKLPVRRDFEGCTSK